MEAEAHEDERIPCTDEMCTGIVGPGGRCGTCGRLCAPETREGFTTLTMPSETEEPRETEAADEIALPRGDEPDRTDADERVLCPDGMCTGVLGPDGKCGTCGQTTGPG